jgi:O-antigen ligase
MSASSTRPEAVSRVLGSVASGTAWLRSVWLQTFVPVPLDGHSWARSLQSLISAVAIAVGTVGGLSLHHQWPGLAAVGLDWNASSSGPFSGWIYWAWPAVVCLAPAAFESPAFGLGLYVFTGYSVLGTENAAISLQRDGILDWTLAIIAASAALGCWYRREGFFLRRTRQTAVLAAVVCWAVICLIVAAWPPGALPAPLPYRRPVLWLHSLAALVLCVRALDSPERIRRLILFTSLVLVWRLALARSSAWLEGHVASYIALVLPWLFFSISAKARAERWVYWATASLLLAMATWGVPSAQGPLERVLFTRVAGMPVLLWAGGLGVFLVSERYLDVALRVAVVTYLAYVVLAIQNRGAILALFASAGCGWLLLRWRGKLITLALACCVGAAALSLTDVHFLIDRFRSGLEADRTSSDSAGERLRVWEAGAAMARQHPWFGVGPGQFSNRVRAFFPPDLPSSSLDAHNSWMQVLGEMGWPGALLFSAFWLQILVCALAAMRRGRTARDCLPLAKAALCFWIAYVVAGMFGARNDLPLAYVLAGCGVAVFALADRPVQRNNGRSITT